ncbi:hypothetical protein [Nostoc punctiforme]|nr:hypothetical protein [Nostoc punctiforme]
MAAPTHKSERTANVRMNEDSSLTSTAQTRIDSMVSFGKTALYKL